MHLPRCLIFLVITFGISLCDDDPSSSDVVYDTPVLNDPSIYFYDHFDDVNQFRTKWVKSQGKKKQGDGDADYDGAWELEQAVSNGLPRDYGLVLKNKAKHSAISSKLKRPFKFELKPLIVQYEVLFQEGQECGGAYLKLLTDNTDNKNLSHFTDLSQYTIMFGPDKCGNDFKLHFIFKHKNPLTGAFEEKHCKKPDVKLDGFFSDKKPHMYTLILYPDNTFKILIDHNVVNQGSLLNDFTPEVNPPAEIDDPTDVRPADWDFREKIPDPSAKKPEDWDEDAPASIPDPDAVKPDGWLDNEPIDIRDPDAEKPVDWDSEMDGEWEAPLIPNPICQDAPGCGQWTPSPIENPNYKGKWVAPLIDNPNYKGEWKPKRIPNPDYFEDKNPFKMNTIIAVGFELWSMSPNILFDNLIISDNEKIAEELATKTFDVKNAYFNRNDGSLFSTIVNHTKQKPWLWAVYIVLLLVPVVLAVLFCLGTSDKDKDVDNDAIRKKTDQPEPDDENAGEGSVALNENADKSDDVEVTEEQKPEEETSPTEENENSNEQEQVEDDDDDEDADGTSDKKTSPDKVLHRRHVRAD